MAKPDRNEVVKHLQACVASSKGGVPLSTLGKDYQIISGASLPYKGLGFTKIEEFIESIPEFKLINGPKGEILVQAASSNLKSSHLARIVALQQQTSKNTRFIPRSNHGSNKKNESQTRKPWTRSTNWSPPNANTSNNNRSLRTPSLLRNMSQPSGNIPKSAIALNRSYSNPGNKNSQRQESTSRGNNRMSPDKTSSIPPLLSLDCPAPQNIAIKKPNVTIDYRKKQNDPRTQRKNSGNNNSNNSSEIIYSPVLCPAASVKNPCIPTAEIKATEPIAVLKKYVADHKLGDIEFKTIELVTGLTKQYISSISIGKDFKVNTYPNGGNTAQEALELAAKLAYETLITKMSAASIADLPATENSSEALKRILKILEAHPNGVWANKVPDEYMSLYGEQLPSDWLQQTMKSPQVDPNIISDKQIILVLSDGSQSPKKSPPSSKPLNPESPSFDGKSFETPVDVAPNSLETGKDDTPITDGNAPPPVFLPKEENWDVYVTNANSTTDLWLRLVGDEYSSKYENLATEMELHYLERGPGGCEQVQEGCYYALELDDCVHRVQVATIEGDEVHCLLLDHGQVEKVSAKELRQLEQRFLALPFQAVQCELQGLEEFGTAQEVQALLLEVVVGKTLVATPTKDVLGQPYMVGSPAVTLTLYDTSTDEDVNINQQLWRTITTNVLLPRLPQEGRVAEVAVPHVTSVGHIYVQLHKSVLVCLQDKISLLQPERMPLGTVKQPTKGVTYLAPFVDGCWYRANLLTSSTQESDDKVHVQFIDFGNDSKVEKNKLLELSLLSPELFQIPPQAILCRLHQLLPNVNARVCERTVKRMAELLKDQPDKSFLLKVVSASTPASVELFLRMSSDNLLVSLNSTIALDETLFDSMNDEKQGEVVRRGSQDKEKIIEKDKTTEKIVEKAPRGLSQPKIPEIGGFFDISVTLAASPGNFVVQPWELSPQLEQLMVSLQSLYGAGSAQVQPLTSSDIQEGGIYAAMHNDGKWYRVQVNNLLKGDTLTVFFVDFGDHTVLTIDKLRPLAAKFCQLPYQAIKAKISGIRPKHSDWSVEDCMRFQAMVCNRQFVSVVEETGPDLINPSDTVLGLRLIDTSNDQVDLDIGELLVKEERAVFIG